MQTKDKIIAVSMLRFNGGIKAKRLYGSSTITQFMVYLESEKDKPKFMVEVGGATPGDRKTEAIKRFKENRNN